MEEEFYIGQIFEEVYPPEASIWCEENNAQIDELERTVENGEERRRFQIADMKAPEVTVSDYDRAMEKHIYRTRVERGYTTREPSEYKDSSVPRWRQDALDYIAFRDEVMLYGLSVQNAYAAGEEVPTLEEFKAALPVITWNWVE